MTDPASQAQLIDRTNQYQRLNYDITRHYFLQGRDRLIREFAPPPGARVLEIACRTGRNLARIGNMYQDCSLFGLDISQEMPRMARAK